MMKFFKGNALPALLLTVLLDMLGIGMIIPIIPTLFGDPTNPYFLIDVDHIKEGAKYMGILFALASAGQFIGAPITGQFSDKFGRRKVLMITIIGGAVANAIFAWALTIRALPLVLFSRFAYGLMAGNAAVAGAAVADITPPANRAKNFGLMGAMFGIGFIVGPFVGGKLADSHLHASFNLTTPFIAAVILSLLNAVYVYLVLPETNTHINKSLRINWHQALSNIKKAFNMREVRPMLITSFLFSLGIAFYQGLGGILLKERFGFTEGDLGNYFAYVGVWLVIAQAGLVRVLAKRFTSAQVLSVSFFVMSICFFVIAGNHLKWLLYANAPFLAFAWGSTMANMSSLLSQTASPKIMGEVMGINTSVGALAMMLAPIIGGYLGYTYDVSVPITMAGIMLTVTGLYFVVIGRHQLKAHA